MRAASTTASLWKKGLLAGSTAAGGIAGFVFYDKRTAHPMRQMQEYKWQEGWIRFCNITRPTFTFSEMTLQDLSRYNGDNNSPTYFASDGFVWDVTESKMFRESYALWKGKEASVALAKMSLDPKDVNRTDWDTLNDAELKSLRSWTTYFREKYRIVGRLKGFPSSTG
jgi:predicted heme/steroid binding protein